MGKESPFIIDNEVHLFWEKKLGYIMYGMVVRWFKEATVSQGKQTLAMCYSLARWFIFEAFFALIKKKEDSKKKILIQPWEIHGNQKESERNSLQYKF